MEEIKDSYYKFLKSSKRVNPERNLSIQTQTTAHDSQAFLNTPFVVFGREHCPFEKKLAKRFCCNIFISGNHTPPHDPLGPGVG